MKVTLGFRNIAPNAERADKAWDSANLVVDEAEKLVVPNIGDLVMYLGGPSGEDLRVRKVVRRCLTYSDNACTVNCTTEEPTIEEIKRTLGKA